MKPHNIDFSAQEDVLASDGSHYWRIAMPLPLYTHRWLILPACQCECGDKFKSEADYREHYNLAIKAAEIEREAL